MASSKALLLFGLAFAFFVLTSEVSARELAETTETQEGLQTNGYGHGHGHGYGHGNGHGHGGHGHGHGGHHGGHPGHGAEEGN